MRKKNMQKDVNGTLLLTNLRQIVQVAGDDRCTLLGDEMNKIKVLECPESKLEIFCLEGKIHKIGTSGEVSQHFDQAMLDRAVVVDCQGGSVIPGLVDSHSHPVFAGDRVHEFALKLAGASYMEVQAAGGGIHFTAEKTREADEDQLLCDFLKIADEMLHAGTTLLEAKSGYGLVSAESELKMLRVLDRAQGETPLEISATFCGAHAIPPGRTEQDQTALIVDQMLPKIAALKAEGQLVNTENVDVFCEKGVFELAATRSILEAGKSIGLRPNFHADELFALGGAELAADIGATAVSHLEEISADGIQSLARAGTTAVLLPSTAYVLRLKAPPTRQLIRAGVCVSLGSDFNPNAYCLAMPAVMNLACVLFGLSMPEALVAILCLVGRVADFVVLNTRNWEHLIYRLASHGSVIDKVVKSGRVVYDKTGKC